MTDEVEDKQLPATKETAEYSFLIDEKKHNLTKAHKAIDKETLAAIEYLGTIVRDEEKSTEVRMKAAKDIIDSKLKIADAQNKEFLQRLVAETRKNIVAQPRQLKNVSSGDYEDDELQTPVYTPNVIVDLGNTKL